VLGRVDAIVFTGGIGENASPVRAGVCEDLEHLGISIDAAKNEAASGNNFSISLGNGGAVGRVSNPTSLPVARRDRIPTYTY
jgi:acetate kinase